MWRATQSSLPTGTQVLCPHPCLKVPFMRMPKGGLWCTCWDVNPFCQQARKNVPKRPFSSHFQLVQNCYYLFLVAWGSRTKRWAGEHSNLTDQSRGRAQASITSRDVWENFEVAGLFMALLRKVSLGGSHSSSGSVITWMPTTRPGPCVLNEYSLTEGSTDSLEVFIDANVSYTVN